MLQDEVPQRFLPAAGSVCCPRIASFDDRCAWEPSGGYPVFQRRRLFRYSAMQTIQAQRSLYLTTGTTLRSEVGVLCEV